MSYQRHLAQDRGFRVFHTPEEPVPGETVTLHVTAFDDHGRPMTAGQVTARISGPGQRVDQLTLDGVPGGWGMFRGQFVPGQAGAYRVAIHNTETDRRIELPITVRGSEREPVGRPARLAILREIAQITRGAAGQPADIGEFTRSVSALPESQAAAQRLRLWCHPLWGGWFHFAVACCLLDGA